MNYFFFVQEKLQNLFQKIGRFLEKPQNRGFVKKLREVQRTLATLFGSMMASRLELMEDGFLQHGKLLSFYF